MKGLLTKYFNNHVETGNHKTKNGAFTEKPNE